MKPQHDNKLPHTPPTNSLTTTVSTESDAYFDLLKTVMPRYRTDYQVLLDTLKSSPLYHKANARTIFYDDTLLLRQVHRVLWYLIENNRLNQVNFDALCYPQQATQFDHINTFIQMLKQIIITLTVLQENQLLTQANCDTLLANKSYSHQICQILINDGALTQDEFDIVVACLPNTPGCHRHAGAQSLGIWRLLKRVGLDSDHYFQQLVANKAFVARLNQAFAIFPTKAKPIVDFYFAHPADALEIAQCLKCLSQATLLTPANLINLQRNIAYINSLAEALQWLSTPHHSDHKLKTPKPSVLTQSLLEQLYTQPEQALLIAEQHGGRPIHIFSAVNHRENRGMLSQQAHDFFAIRHLTRVLMLGCYDPHSRLYNKSRDILFHIIRYVGNPMIGQHHGKRLDPTTSVAIAANAIDAYQKFYTQKLTKADRKRPLRTPSGSPTVSSVKKARKATRLKSGLFLSSISVTAASEHKNVGTLEVGHGGGMSNPKACVVNF